MPTLRPHYFDIGAMVSPDVDAAMPCNPHGLLGQVWGLSAWWKGACVRLLHGACVGGLCGVRVWWALPWLIMEWMHCVFVLRCRAG